jgi:hypothetical protein
LPKGVFTSRGKSKRKHWRFCCAGKSVQSLEEFKRAGISKTSFLRCVLFKITHRLYRSGRRDGDFCTYIDSALKAPCRVVDCSLMSSHSCHLPRALESHRWLSSDRSPEAFVAKASNDLIMSNQLLTLSGSSQRSPSHSRLGVAFLVPAGRSVRPCHPLKTAMAVVSVRLPSDIVLPLSPHNPTIPNKRLLYDDIQDRLTHVLSGSRH